MSHNSRIREPISGSIVPILPVLLPRSTRSTVGSLFHEYNAAAVDFATHIERHDIGPACRCLAGVRATVPSVVGYPKDVVGKKLFVFGGYDGRRPSTRYNDVHRRVMPSVTDTSLTRH